MSITAHRLAMLAKTLTHLREHSPFYRQLLPSRGIGPDSAAELLTALPVMDADSWLRARPELRTGLPREADLGFTNGTTGTPKTFYSTPGEREALLRDSGAVRGGPRSLHLIGISHGVVAGLGYGPDATVVPVVGPDRLELAARILAQEGPEFTGAPVRLLSGTLRNIKDLTVMMLDRYGSLNRFGVETVEVGKHILSPRWKERLEAWWGAEIRPVYGFSEMRMCNAAWCATCTYHHLPPSCVGEVLTPGSPWRHVAPGERGTLAVTAFHPYVQWEPRIRYRPGDLVELAGEPCPLRGESGFRPLGREQDCVPRDGTSHVLTPADCFAAVCDLPEVAVGHEGHAITVLRERSHEIGSPRFRISAEKDGPRLHVELRFSPRLWPEETRKVVERIAARLPEDIQVVPYAPGALPETLTV
ncbi:hypothetical protein ABT154_18865 [Streptomyces sp. NPDC001728]|uniref:hypothetical protein n=1 Tax=Streptomyces sp. NPDC001728 TaxID=3154396 RepID=UPI003320383E